MIRSRFHVLSSFALLLLLLFGSGCVGFKATGAHETKPADLIVMTYNIRIGAGAEGGWKDDTANLERIADFILESEADIVLLQEVDRNTPRTGGMDQAAFLAERTGFHYSFASAIEMGDGHYGVALLSRWPIAQSAVYPLYKPDYSESHPEYPDYYSEQRVAQVAEIAAPGGLVTVINTHLGLTADQRARQIEEITALADARDREPLLVCGDLNAEPGAPELQPLRSFLADCYGDLPVEDRLTFHSLDPDRCIDYIFVSGHWRIEDTRVPTVTYSDHRPVVTRLAR